ncbi:tripartite tricarboxylate transporter TctB family protein [Brevibacterium yomogidense]|uniref:tripartite tricarboxylate transporter TctB family protein n=1 Tax=Brevibacterium yomogidense TaxID=946573 RepID=UPI0018DF21DB|nr:tripartite tricarboxylate transporter TctB family protein [Brevibacterium yomogidense]
MRTLVSSRRKAWWKEKRSDIVGTLIMGALGAAATLMGLGYGVFVEGNHVGPGFMPMAIGIFIFGASMLELGRILIASDSLKENSVMAVVETTQQDAAEQIAEVQGELDTFGRTQKQRNRAPFYIFLVLAVALLLVDLLGLVVSFALAVAFMVIVIERRPWWVGIIATSSAVAFIYVIFKLILNIPLPTGYLGLI